jgi:leucyl aminopeptidase (aminopeptidase T)
MDLASGAKKVVEVCAGVKPGETVLIITDKDRPFSVASALAGAADAIGAEVNILIAPPLRLPGEEPGSLVAAALKESNVVFAATTQTIGHSDCLRKALNGGTRCLALTGCTEHTFTSGAIEADFLKIGSLVEFVKNRFDAAKKVHVSAPGGTHIQLDIDGRKASTCSGLCHNPGEMIGIPDVEVYIAPNEDQTFGKLVVDASFSSFGLIESPVCIGIEKGIVTSIEGGKEAQKLTDLLDSIDDSAARVIAEFAIGLNPKGKVRGNIIEDEGVYGTGHFALGNNIGFGGLNKAPIHFDMVYHKPTIYLDGKVFMENGRLSCLDEELENLTM